jgi:hypothetical protein
VTAYSSHTRHDSHAGHSDEAAMATGKDPDGPKLMSSRAVWRAFTAAVQDGEFDLG